MLVDSSRSTAVVAITIAGALVMNWIVAAEQIPAAMGAWMISLDMSPAMFLLDGQPAVPGARRFPGHHAHAADHRADADADGACLGIDPVHFGVTAIVNMMIGLVTPPMGELVFLIAGVSGVSVTAITKELWLFLVVLIALLFVLVYVPELTLWLPEQMGYQPVTAPAT